MCSVENYRNQLLRLFRLFSILLLFILILPNQTLPCFWLFAMLIERYFQGELLIPTSLAEVLM